MDTKYILIATLILTLGHIAPCDPARTFHNPILDTAVNGPFVHQHMDGYYYMTLTLNSIDLYVYKSNTLSDWRLAERKLVYSVPSGFTNAGQSEIHHINENYYIYFQTMVVNGTNYDMYVLEAENPANLLGRYGKEIMLKWNIPAEETGRWDGTVMQYSNGKLYFLYVGIPVNQTALNLFIAPMSSPTALNGSRILLRETGTPPSKSGLVSPHVFQEQNRTFLLYTGASDEVNCLGLMGIDDGRDPLVADSWWHHADGCVFEGNVEQSVWNPGYACVTKSQDLQEDWIVYHAQQGNITAASSRTARIDKFSWNEDGTPKFPKPTGPTIAMALPSGEN